MPRFDNFWPEFEKNIVIFKIPILKLVLLLNFVQE